MTKLNIVFMLFRRSYLSEITMRNLAKCKDLDFKVILTGHPSVNIEPQAELARELGLNHEVYISKEPNYTDRLFKGIESDAPYIMKLDEDVIINESTFRFLFSKIDLLENEENILLTHALTGGIPTVEDFIREYCTEEEKNELYSIFSQARVPNDFWGSNFIGVNKELEYNKYSPEGYWNAIKNVPHFYKGLHPVRHNAASQKKLNEFVMRHIEKFNQDRDYEVREMHEPYFCNSSYIIKKEELNKILTDKSLFVDAFDEVPINSYRDRTGKKFLVVKDSFSIHIMYNTIGDQVDAGYEKEMFEKIKEKVL